MKKPKIEIKFVHTIKIQSIENGKRTTRRRFNVDARLPKVLSAIINSFTEDVCREIYAEKMSFKDWVSLIKKHTCSKQLRGWAASIIWFKYGGNEDSVLYRLSKQYDSRDHKPKLKQVMMLLDRMGCPRFINDYAADREKERTIKVKEYIKQNKPILIDWRIDDE